MFLLLEVGLFFQCSCSHSSLSGLVIKVLADNDDDDVAGGRGEFCETTKDRQLAQSLVVVSVRAQLVDVFQPERLLDKTKTQTCF